MKRITHELDRPIERGDRVCANGSSVPIGVVDSIRPGAPDNRCYRVSGPCGVTGWYAWHELTPADTPAPEHPALAAAGAALLDPLACKAKREFPT